MKKSLMMACLSLLMAMAGCTSDFIGNPEYRAAVENDLASRADIMKAAGIDLDEMGLTERERQAMGFLYAYMPLGDVLNNSPEYFLKHYRLTQRALKEMSWGKTIPERELRHFVLPVRVNNENLDDSRELFYDELAPRVRDLSMYDAVLEVNHWCHEKAIYMPSDRRTSSPLATVKTAYGRCGEESTLLVAALRSVGIPARQVYTPRWAHTDSNHAWVEAWVDGQWYFLGACEPEPVLNLGWFNAPASRGMLMHTNVTGKYDGPEDVVGTTPIHTEINVIGNYAPESAPLDVRVVDMSGNPVIGAKVEFKISNYSNFDTVASKSTDGEGKCSLTAGLGDMLIYASHGGRFGFRKVTYGKDTEVTVALKYAPGDKVGHVEMEVVPPVENARLPKVTDEQVRENKCRLEYEDSIRNAYVATFFDVAEAEEFAQKKGLDKERTVRVLVASRGNHDQIASFLLEADGKGRSSDALDMLESLAEKDLRDTPKTVLDDHLYNTPSGSSVKNVLCPRVETELLTPYRGYLQKNVPQSLADSVRTDPALLVAWCRDNLKLRDEITLRYVQVSPSRVWDTGIADKTSRDIFFVAMCRSFGVPAWRDTVTGVVKYEKDGLTYNVDFDAQKQEVAPQGKLKIRYREIPLLDDPKYKTHFTLSKYVDGSFRLLNYGGSWKSLFAYPQEIDCGCYLLTCGARMSGGNVFADMEFFTIEEGKTTEVDMKIRDDASQIRVIGSFDSEARYVAMPAPGTAGNSVSADLKTSSEGAQTSVLLTTGRGYFTVALVDYGTEPVNHAFMDISAAAKELEKWGRPLLVIFASEEDYRKFRADHFSLPSTVRYGVDADGSIRQMIAREMKLSDGGSLPLIVMADTFNRVVFFSQGYTIGLGDRLVKTSKAL